MRTRTRVSIAQWNRQVKASMNRELVKAILYVRNPMITGVLFMLSAEAMLFQSWPLALWMGIFFMGNAIYFPLVEEKGLEKRFADDYRRYKANVPRWIPRLHPWIPDKDKYGTKNSDL